ncbi:MAG: hypothetical protein AAGC68_07650 [Verrucomicrobiota bacterium]
MSEFIIEIEKLLRAIADPEYRYLLIEPLILYGILIGVGMLTAGFFLKAPKLQFVALVVIGLSAFAHVPYKEARLAAKPRMEQVYKISAPARVSGFNENTKAWLAETWRFRLLVLAAVITLMIGIDRNRLGFGLGVATALLGLLVAKNTMWLHYQDALAYHPNLTKHEAPIDGRQKSSPPPANASQKKREPAGSLPKQKVATPPSRETPTPQANRSLSSSSRQSPASSLPPGRVPPPAVPVSPQPRVVKPLR